MATTSVRVLAGPGTIQDWADALARVTLAAGLITVAVPVIFFALVVPAERRLIIENLRSYIVQRCALVRPWVVLPSAATITWPGSEGQEVLIQEKNHTLRVRAFFLCVMTLLVAGGLSMLMWTLFGRASLSSVLIRAGTYLVVFCTIETAFIMFMLSMPMVDLNAIDLTALDAVIGAARSCPLVSTATAGGS